MRLEVDVRTNIGLMRLTLQTVTIEGHAALTEMEQQQKDIYQRMVSCAGEIVQALQFPEEVK